MSDHEKMQRNTKMEILLFVIAVLGIAIITSYYYALRDGNDYLTNKYWLGMPKNVVSWLIVLQLFAAVGFIMGIWSLSTTPPENGFLSKHDGRVGLYIIIVALVGSLIWPWATRQAMSCEGSPNMTWVWITSISLIITGVSALVLVAGSFQDPQPVLVLGWVLFAVVVCIVDGTGWNSVFLQKALSSQGELC
jgi:hypothetical protein